MNPEILITDFQPGHQPGIDLLYNDIQSEFPEPIYGPGIRKIADVAGMEGRKYWVALHRELVIGTVGIVDLGNTHAALKSMMLHKDYRGAEKQVAHNLLMMAMDYAKLRGARQIFLGTMVQFRAAQFFYKKYGFVEIGEEELPGDFMKNPVDKVFFKLHI